jgi:hypothetical protein
MKRSSELTSLTAERAQSNTSRERFKVQSQNKIKNVKCLSEINVKLSFEKLVEAKTKTIWI